MSEDSCEWQWQKALSKEPLITEAELGEINNAEVQ